MLCMDAVLSKVWLPLNVITFVSWMGNPFPMICICSWLSGAVLSYFVMILLKVLYILKKQYFVCLKCLCWLFRLLEINLYLSRQLYRMSLLTNNSWNFQTYVIFIVFLKQPLFCYCPVMSKWDRNIERNLKTSLISHLS